MTKLSDTQRVILSAASQRTDRLARNVSTTMRQPELEIKL